MKDNRTAHIAALSRRLRYGIWSIVGLTAVAILALLVEGYATAEFVIGDIRLDVADLSAQSVAVLAVTLLPLLLIVCWLAWLADRLLALYQRGEIFGRTNAEIIRRAGKLIVLLSVLGSVVEPVLGWYLTQSGLAVEHWSFQPRLGTVFIGLGIIVVGHVMSLGAELAEEQSLTI